MMTLFAPRRWVTTLAARLADAGRIEASARVLTLSPWAARRLYLDCHGDLDVAYLAAAVAYGAERPDVERRF